MLYAPWYGHSAVPEAQENIRRGKIAQSVAVSASGNAWTDAVMHALFSESECITFIKLSGTAALRFSSRKSETEWSNKTKKAIALLDEWMDDDSGYDEKTWPELKQSLDRYRLSNRRLFDAEGDPS